MKDSKISTMLDKKRREKLGIFYRDYINVRSASALLIQALIDADPGEKQYHIEQAFREMCKPEYVDQAKAYFKWPDGTQPLSPQPSQEDKL